MSSPRSAATHLPYGLVQVLGASDRFAARVDPQAQEPGACHGFRPTGALMSLLDEGTASWPTPTYCQLAAGN